MDSHTYQFPKEGEDGWNPNLSNLKTPVTQMKFPSFKGKEVVPLQKTKEFKEPEDIPVLTKQELQV
jgi:hypothetical protein